MPLPVVLLQGAWRGLVLLPDRRPDGQLLVRLPEDRLVHE